MGKKIFFPKCHHKVNSGYNDLRMLILTDRISNIIQRAKGMARYNNNNDNEKMIEKLSWSYKAIRNIIYVYIYTSSPVTDLFNLL